jgi:polyphosphate kinase
MSEVIHKIWRRLQGQVTTRRPQTSTPGSVTPLAVKPPQQRYLNREISDLQFIERVLEEANNTRHPFFERVRFLAISAAVLDQFYTVRVARLHRMAAEYDFSPSPDGLTAPEELSAINTRADSLVAQQQLTWLNHKGEFHDIGIQLLSFKDLSTVDKDWLRSYFTRHILPMVTPFTLDEEHPFPFISSGGICVVLEFEHHHILIPLPGNLSRFIALQGQQTRFITFEEVLLAFGNLMFSGNTLISGGSFQILRDNDLAKQQRSEDLRSMVESGLRLRNKANVIRLKIENLSEANVRFIAFHLGLLSAEAIAELDETTQRALDQAFVVTALPGLSQVSQLVDATRYPGLVFETFKPRYPQRLLDFDNDCFAAINSKDLLVHWPYESFDVIVRFLEQAATDAHVLSIKQTLYRTSDNSPIVNAMVDAASRGKTVTAVIELEARDNEQANVALAKRLEAAGVQIVYGIIGLKIHCKLTIVTRREDDDVAIYSHFGTGNYHPGNARTYTDLSFFTRDMALGIDANQILNYITSEHFVATENIAAAPKQLRQSIYTHIDAEIAHAQAGRPAAIWAKVNSLTDPELIDRLYEASEAGVRIDLIIRRHCSLLPGVPGMSSNITVKSIVGRFLEHARIYCFANGSDMSSDTAAIYLASADWMERNLDERVEVMVPMHDPTVRAQILDQIMRANINDSRQSWYLHPDGEYLRATEADDFCAQTYFMQTPNLSGLGSSRSSVTIAEPYHVSQTHVS